MKQKRRRTLWIKVLKEGKGEIRKMYVCSKHFNCGKLSYYFYNYWNSITFHLWYAIGEPIDDESRPDWVPSLHCNLNSQDVLRITPFHFTTITVPVPESQWLLFVMVYPLQVHSWTLRKPKTPFLPVMFANQIFHTCQPWYLSVLYMCTLLMKLTKFFHVNRKGNSKILFRCNVFNFNANYKQPYRT
jgi:hypothetical protein